MIEQPGERWLSFSAVRAGKSAKMQHKTTIPSEPGPVSTRIENKWSYPGGLHVTKRGQSAWTDLRGDKR